MKQPVTSRIFFIFLVLGSIPTEAFPADTDSNPIWPLCGRITENPPPGWVDTDGCPAGRFGDPAYSDEPLSATFGPRPLASESNRYDFHRGVDIATPSGTPFFAIADGIVQTAGTHPSFSDPLVRVRHFRPGETSCNAGGCYNSLYLHISSAVVAENDTVVKGQLLGYTGASGSGFEHLHFEMRDAPDFDPFSSWQRDSIHPLQVVPYQAPNNTTIQFNNVDFTDPLAGIVDLTVTSNRFDLMRVELTLLDGALAVIPQSGNTPDARGYNVAPSFFDMDAWNFQYTHKDSTNFPWSSYGAGGVNECPYHADHGGSYDAHVHMDQQDPGNYQEGLFNGLHIRTQKYWPSDVDDYTVDLEFLALEGDPACVQATATFASGDTGFAEWGSCSGGGNQPPVADFSWSCTGFSCDFDASSSSDPDGSVVSYAWDFGDGNGGSGAIPSHVFAGPGSYSVTLTVTDNDAASDNTIESVSVTDALLVRGPYLQMQTDDGITVRWRTDIATDSVVRYGPAADNLNQSVTVGGSRTEHEVALTGLGTAQSYFYSVGDSVAPISGDASHHFSTAPTPGDAADVRFWVLGDSGTANADARDVRDAYKAYASGDPADLIVMLGDNAYNDGTDAEYQAAVFDTYPELLRQISVVSTLGNHDGHTADSASQTGPYYDIFNLPTAAEMGGLASGTEAYYSFDYANVHFICLDSYETSRSPGGAMLTWLESDLALNTQPWVVAFWHHPPYTKGSHDSDTEGRLIDMRQNALPILEEWGVDLVLAGHSHSYERSYLIDGHYGSSTSLDPVDNVLDPGDGSETGDGAYEKPDVIAAYREGAVYAVAGSSGKISGGSLDHPAMFVSMSVLGSMILDVSGNRMDVLFLDDVGAVCDEFTLLKTPDVEPPLLTGASAEDATHVLVNFDEALDSLEAENAANYAIADLSISQAELLGDARSVRLTTSAMTPDAHYTLIVNNVQDVALNTIAPNSQVEFDFFDIMTKSFQDAMLPDPGYDGTFDAYIREASASTNYGAASTLQVDGDEPSGSATDMNIVIGWDISAIPTDAIVLDAQVDFVVTNASSGAYQCYALLAPWNQAEVTWDNASGDNPWGAPGASSGADRGSDVLCTLTAGSTGALTMPFTPEGLAQVQAWVSNPAANHGLVIANPTTGDGADLHSSESGTVMSRPKLSVTYRVPAGNTDPVASFTHSCTELACNFSDTSTDADGSITGWSWDFGDGNGSTAQNPAHSFASAGSYTVSLTVTDDDGLTDNTSTLVTVSVPPAFVDAVAAADLPGTGSVSGTFSDTHTDNGFAQSITETESGGKPSRRLSQLEHTWRFSVSPGTMITLYANAWSSGSADGDSFVFAWSSDNSSFNDLLTVSSTDPSNVQSASVPSSGTVYIRVRDTDRTQGNRELNSVFVDKLYIRSENGPPPTPPAAPTGLGVSGTTSDSISLSWSHPSADETGFELERAPASSGSWAQVATPSGGTESFVDNGLPSSTAFDYRIRAVNAGGESAWSNVATGTTDAPPPSSISLSATGRVKRGEHEVKLTWSGASGASVDVFRDSVLIATSSNNGRYTDKTGNSGSRTYVYQVCEAGTSNCSNEVLVAF
ncbi:MAG: PKD domain-containing protein [Xanthomonadales bacterium]|nr:PKD domain-containing protein [Xanthomonadales bacterium]